ncbi:phage integrase SAM-like domain-containing protein [Mucilaginibacter sp. OK283]|uniref:phage integrase SAM-like domain-containing protein n=1 Tax=Mucilaginibacter sp. OK283 TaxID=1881049 RepID=UPI0008B1F6B7|nr:phage integrase SAM-like domain-containing protein [Mucilaginibacter sp. OK283]SEO99391.1 Phage integrase SAM-like domain-containing protein [Mucilaginibacter sp. OK283]
MATIKEVVLKHHKKEDGTYNIKFRLTHNRKVTYINTNHFAGEKQLKKDFTVKDRFLLSVISTEIAKYRMRLLELDRMLVHLDVKQLASRLTEPDENAVIDIIAFARQYVSELKEQGRKGSAYPILTVINSLCDYFGSQKVEIDRINSIMLPDYERYLRKERRFKRKNQFGKDVNYVSKGLSDSGLHNHIRDLRTLFNAARDRFNDEDRGLIRIKHYPFKKHKVIEAPMTAKRALTVKQIVKILEFNCIPGSRAELAKEIFLLSFYMCGMNAKDIYDLSQSSIVKNRVNYNRSKTRKRRKDSAFISINLIPEASPLLFKHIGRLRERYAESSNFNKALNKGLKEIGEAKGIPSLTMYCARHSFGSIARNECRFSKDDVAFALNHIDHTTRTTDIYIKPDWQIIDDVQLKVVSLLNLRRGK